jgi:hypothetical protein
MDVLAPSDRATVMNQVRFKMARLGLIPGKASHRDVPSDLFDPFRASAGRAGLILPDPLQTAFYGGNADVGQLLEQVGRSLQFAVGGQMLSQPPQVRS